MYRRGASDSETKVNQVVVAYRREFGSNDQYSKDDKQNERYCSCSSSDFLRMKVVIYVLFMVRYYRE